MPKPAFPKAISYYVFGEFCNDRNRSCRSPQVDALAKEADNTHRALAGLLKKGFPDRRLGILSGAGSG